MTAQILIVDDEKDLAYFLKEALRLRFPDVDVDLAYSGEEALSRLAVHLYDLIIADYRMPGFSGLDLIKGVRYLDQRTSIILMTAYGSAELGQEVKKLGIARYFAKPFDMDDMLSAVSQILSDSK